MLTIALVATGLVAPTSLKAETLTFDNTCNGCNIVTLGVNYGDRLPGTPNVVVDFDPASDISTWTTAYGDLTGVIYRESEGAGILTITFTADPGFLVTLTSFELAGWPNADYTINSVQVLSGTTPLFSQSNVLIQGDASGPGHTTFSFAMPLSAQTLTIRFDASNLGGNSDNIGIDNVVFGQLQQQPEPVPEPATMLLLGSGLAGFAMKIRRRRAQKGERS